MNTRTILVAASLCVAAIFAVTTAGSAPCDDKASAKKASCCATKATKTSTAKADACATDKATATKAEACATDKATAAKSDDCGTSAVKTAKAKKAGGCCSMKSSTSTVDATTTKTEATTAAVQSDAK